MKNLFEIAETCLFDASIPEKLLRTHEAARLGDQDLLRFESLAAPIDIDATRFPERPQWLPPKQMPRRQMNTPEGLAAFFHALAHIEFVAIYLAWDIIYRFRGLPVEFYCDWLRVADEEAQHFMLLQGRLAELGIAYGDLPAHGGLWEHARDTRHDVLARLAVVPRCLEARGLDVTPAMIVKLEEFGDSNGAAILTRIMNDEVGHVLIGSKWFSRFCREQGLDPDRSYRQLLDRYFKGKPKGPFNREMRIMAGFSIAELDWLEHEQR